MKYSEFEREAKTMFMTVSEDDEYVYLRDDGDDVATVSRQGMFILDTDYGAFWFLHSEVQNTILNWCCQLAKTQLEEREDER